MNFLSVTAEECGRWSAQFAKEKKEQTTLFHYSLFSTQQYQHSAQLQKFCMVFVNIRCHEITTSQVPDKLFAVLVKIWNQFVAGIYLRLLMLFNITFQTKFIKFSYCTRKSCFFHFWLTDSTIEVLKAKVLSIAYKLYYIFSGSGCLLSTCHDKMACINIEEEKLLSNSSSPETNPDFLVIRIIGRIVISVIKHCWALSTAMFISICIFYWIFGGISAFILLCFSAAGKKRCYPFINQMIHFSHSIFRYCLPCRRPVAILSWNPCKF